MARLTAIAVFLRRLAGGGAGAPTTLLAGQPFHNEAEGVLYVGTGNDGSGNSTAQVKVGGVGAFVDLASAQTIAGRKTFGASPTVPNGAATSDVAAFGQIAAAPAPLAPLASPAFTGTPTAPTRPGNDNSTSLATTAFVVAALSALAAGLQVKPTANWATAAALPAYTCNNAAGTLTASANGALAIDTGAPAVGDVVLVSDETGANAAYNGLYTVTATGSSSTGWVLTRHVDMATATEFAGAIVPVGNASAATGGTQSNSLWLCNPARSLTLGTTAVSFAQLNLPTQFQPGGGISISGNTISIPGWGTVATGSLLKLTASGLAAAVAGTDFVAPFSAIDPGTA